MNKLNLNAQTLTGLMLVAAASSGAARAVYVAPVQVAAPVIIEEPVVTTALDIAQARPPYFPPVRSPYFPPVGQPG